MSLLVICDSSHCCGACHASYDARGREILPEKLVRPELEFLTSLVFPEYREFLVLGIQALPKMIFEADDVDNNDYKCHCNEDTNSDSDLGSDTEPCKPASIE